MAAVQAPQVCGTGVWIQAVDGQEEKWVYLAGGRADGEKGQVPGSGIQVEGERSSQQSGPRVLWGEEPRALPFAGLHR